MFTPPDVPAWRRAIDVALATGGMVVHSSEALGRIFYAFHVYDFCEKYKKKFDKAFWRGFRSELPHDPPSYAAHRRAMHDVLEYGSFYVYVPTFFHEGSYGPDVVAQRQRREDIYARINEAAVPGFAIRLADQTYEVTADLMGSGPYITPQPAPDVEASVYALADIIAPCVGLWENASA